MLQGHGRARQVHRGLGEQLEAVGATLLDEELFWVTPTGRVRVYDPKRTVAGTWVVAASLTNENPAAAT